MGGNWGKSTSVIMRVRGAQPAMRPQLYFLLGALTTDDTQGQGGTWEVLCPVFEGRPDGRRELWHPGSVSLEVGEGCPEF